MPTSSSAASAAAPVAGLGWRNPHFLLFLSAVLWGMTWPAARTMALHLPPISSASWRFTLACIPMLAMVYIKNKGWPALSGRQYRWLALSGVVGVVGYMVCFMWGLSLVPAGRGSLVITFNPVITAIGAAIFLRERISARMLLGMAVATLGALTVITHGEFSRLWAGGVGKGELILLGCSFTWGAYNLMSKRSMQFTDSLTATTYPIVLGTLVLLLTGPALDTHLVGKSTTVDWAAVPWTAWAALVFLAFGATVAAYNWFFTGVDRLGATSASAYNTLVPIFGVLFSWLLLGEQMDGSLLVGGSIAVLGLAIMNGLAASWLRKTAAT